MVEVGQGLISHSILNFLLEDSCFTVLCSFQRAGKGNQRYVCTPPGSFGFPPLLGQHRALRRVP